MVDARVVILGGGVAGLTSALALARRGWAVTVVERDPGPPTSDGDEAFLAWERRSVPQFRQPHAFSARSRTLLAEHLPDILDRLRDDGIEEWNVFKMLAPRELWEPSDDAFTGLLSRRPAFELALRLAAEAEPGVRLLSPAVATSLLADRVDGGVRVRGVEVAGLGRLEADVVLDCGGRRTPVPRWLAALGVPVPEDLQDCGGTYAARYYRRSPSCPMPPVALFGVRGEFEGIMFLGFLGDHDTYGLAMAYDPTDEELRVLRHTWAWEAVARAVPAMAPWVGPECGTPLHDVQVMAGHQNVRRRYVVEGVPLALGLLAVGDALCTTNPAYGWGASMALTYAFAAVDAVERHPDDPVAAALAYDESVSPEADDVYRESAAMDRVRLYQSRRIPVPADDQDEVDRQNLVEAIREGAFSDPVLGRALLRRAHLVDRPGAILDDDDVVARAEQVRGRLTGAPAAKAGPDRDELRAILAAAAPVPVPEPAGR